MSALNLSLPVRTRLANRKADKSYRNYLSVFEPGNCFGRRCTWFNDVATLETVWRFKGYADEVASLRHSGYYTDSFQDGTCRGIVVQLPGRDGHEVFAPGFACTDSDTVCVFPDEYDDESDAAHAADSLAERYAEDAREGDAEFQAERETEDLKAEVTSLRDEIKSLQTELTSVRQGGHKLAARTIRRRIKDAREQIERDESRIEALADNHWLAVDGN